MLDTVYRDGAQFLTLAEQAVLFMVFALGAFSMNDAKADMYYYRAQSVMQVVLAETSMESTVFSFLVSLYQQTTGRISAAWITWGTVVRIAQALGCMFVLSNYIN
jgi:Fungal specific transcription factor domain